MTTQAQSPTVRMLMTRDPIVAEADLPLAEAAELMDANAVSGLPVVDDGGRLVGVLSQTDLLHARAAEALWKAWPGLAVRHLMTQPAVTVTADTDVGAAAELMDRLRIHRLVVIDAAGEPIGVLSVTDLVRAMAQGRAS